MNVTTCNNCGLVMGASQRALHRHLCPGSKPEDLASAASDSLAEAHMRLTALAKHYRANRDVAAVKALDAEMKTIEKMFTAIGDLFEQ